MAGYFIYLPKVRARPDDFTAAGCGELLAGSGPTAFACDRGPDGGGGTLFAWQGQRATLPAVSYQPDRQRWEACKPKANAECGMRNGELGDAEHSALRTPHSALERPAGSFWIGCDAATPPRPEDLALPTMREGYWVELADGGKWLVPEAERLPRKWGLNPAGEFAKIVAAPFGEFCLAAERMKAWSDDQVRVARGDANSGDVPPVTDGELWRYCVQALAVNYRVNADVVDFLGLLAEDASIVAGQGQANCQAIRVLFATLGGNVIPLVEADQKKTA